MVFINLKSEGKKGSRKQMKVKINKSVSEEVSPEIKPRRNLSKSRSDTSVHSFGKSNEGKGHSISDEDSKDDELMRTAMQDEKLGSPIPNSILSKIADKSMRDIEF